MCRESGTFPSSLHSRAHTCNGSLCRESTQVTEEMLKGRLFLGNLKCSLIKTVFLITKPLIMTIFFLNLNHLGQFKNDQSILQVNLNNSSGDLERLQNAQLKVILTQKISCSAVIILLSIP